MANNGNLCPRMKYDACEEGLRRDEQCPMGYVNVNFKYCLVELCITPVEILLCMSIYGSPFDLSLHCQCSDTQVLV